MWWQRRAVARYWRCQLSPPVGCHPANRQYASQPRRTLSQYTYGISFDIDGVLLRGQHPIPGASTTIQQLLLTHAIESVEQPVPIICLSNSGGVTEADKALQINQRLLPHSPVKFNASHMVLSHTPMQQLVHKYSDKRVLCIGTGALRDVMQSYGFEHVVTADQLAALDLNALPHLPAELALHDRTEHTEQLQSVPVIDAIMVLHDPIVWDRDIQKILDVLLYNQQDSGSQIPVYFSNPDIVFSGQYHAPRLAQGAFRVALQAVYERLTGQKLQYTLFGKPESTQFEYAYNALNQHAKNLHYAGVHHVYHIGDNIHADIQGANQAERPFTSIYVKNRYNDTARHLRQSTASTSVHMQRCHRGCAAYQIDGAYSQYMRMSTKQRSIEPDWPSQSEHLL